MKRMMSAHFTILMLLFNDSYSLYRMTDSFTLFNDINVFFRRWNPYVVNLER